MARAAARVVVARVAAARAAVRVAVARAAAKAAAKVAAERAAARVAEKVESVELVAVAVVPEETAAAVLRDREAAGMEVEMAVVGSVGWMAEASGSQVEEVSSRQWARVGAAAAVAVLPATAAVPWVAARRVTAEYWEAKRVAAPCQSTLV